MMRLAWLALALCFLAACANTSDAPLPMVHQDDPTWGWSLTTSTSERCRSERDQQDIAMDGEAAD